ncbi:hypothetical protein DXG03_009125 [Asterophora parasitica]|uniref:EthD domain-containing protein n=1 Tax=Asterophora parasitica TaxID=117018 RepID=A0A9P7G6K1_9AGAR|nr:hypothetical protein DXG03_009125 [Asterophora parasitica]
MSTQARTDRVQLFVFLKRNPDVSKEEFARYWTEEVAPIYNSLDIVKRNKITVQQVALPNDTFTAAPNPSGLDFGDWDGVGTIEAASFDHIFETLLTVEYKTLYAEAPKFLDLSKCRILPVDVVA